MVDFKLLLQRSKERKMKTKSMNHEIVTLKYKRIITDTEKADFFEFAGGERAWFPKSATDIDVGDKTVQVPATLAVEHEVENYAV